MASKVFLGNIKGPKGDPGEKGNPGDPGPIGKTGVRGSRFVTGNGITGINTTPAVYDTGIEDSLINDQYLNQYTGDLYRCTKSGDSSTAEWVWTANLKPLTDTINAYTKSESDEKFLTKTESDETFLKKTDSIDAYTKTESDEKYAVKDDLVDAYSKTESDEKYAAKTDIVDAYSKTESDEKYAVKGENINTYTKDEIDNLLDAMLPVGCTMLGDFTVGFDPVTPAYGTWDIIGQVTIKVGTTSEARHVIRRIK